MFLTTENIAALQWNFRNEFVPDSKSTNIFIAVFTTSWARLKLYSQLEKIQGNLLYFDTDRYIYFFFNFLNDIFF